LRGELPDDKTIEPTTKQLVDLHQLTRGLAGRDIPKALKEAGRSDLLAIWLRNRKDPTPERRFEDQFSRLADRFAEDAKTVAVSLGPPFSQAVFSAQEAGNRLLLAMAGLCAAYGIDEERRRRFLSFKRRGTASDAGLAFHTAPPERGLRFFRMLSRREREAWAAVYGHENSASFEASFPPQDTSKRRRRSTINGVEARFMCTCTERRLSKGTALRLMEIAYRRGVPVGGGRAFDRPAVARRRSCLPISEEFLLMLALRYQL
jgi:hypothetical protein